MLDLVRLLVKAGNGGDGKVSFFRNKRVLKGGPDGGSGGDGGNILVEVDEKLNTLQHFSGKKQFVAGDGEPGGRARRAGARGEDIKLRVPVGTVVWLEQENQISRLRRERVGLRQALRHDDLARERYTVEKETAFPPAREKDEVDWKKRTNFNDFHEAREVIEDNEYAILETGKLLRIVTLSEVEDKIILCQGGFGGRGNNAFKSARQTTPMEAEYGTFGEEKVVFLELQLLANVGLLGFPNVGKSSLLKRLTGARPRVAHYPFTTIEPNLGVLKLDQERNLVVADIPGLVEGASEGKGLGFTFLRHLQNCQSLVFVLSLTEEQIYDVKLRAEDKSAQLWRQYQQLKVELETYSTNLGRKSEVVVLNKIDLYDEKLQQALKDNFAHQGIDLTLLSTVTNEGIAKLREKLAAAI